MFTTAIRWRSRICLDDLFLAARRGSRQRPEDQHSECFPDPNVTAPLRLARCFRGQGTEIEDDGFVPGHQPSLFKKVGLPLGEKEGCCTRSIQRNGKERPFQSLLFAEIFGNLPQR